MIVPLRLLSLLGLVLVLTGFPALAAAPVVSQLSVTPQPDGKADLKVTVQAVGTDAQVRVDYKPGGDPAFATKPLATVTAGNTQELTTTLEDLIGGQLYTFKVVAESGMDTASAEQEVEIAPYKPILKNFTVVDKGSGTATMQAFVTSNGSPTTLSFIHIAPGGIPSTSTKPADRHARDAEAKFEPANLIGGQEYKFQIKARNAHGEDATTEITLLMSVYEPTIHRVFSTQIDLQTVRLNAQVTSNGTVLTGGPADRVFFTYWETANEAATKTEVLAERSDTDPAGSLRADDILHLFSIEPTGLKRDTQYSYRFRVGSKEFPDTLTFTIGNNPPVAISDTVLISGTEPVLIDVLKNDRDPDGDPIDLVSTRKPSGGTAVVVGGVNAKKVLYTPGPNFTGEDTFTYIISDRQVGGTAVGEVTVRAPRFGLAGLHGGLIQNSEGKNVGYVRLHATSGGAFTGKIEINGKAYSLSGVMQLNGRYVGFATGDDGTIPVEFTLYEGEDGATSILGNFGNGQWITSMPSDSPKLTDLESLVGRYTVELPMGQHIDELGNSLDIGGGDGNGDGGEPGNDGNASSGTRPLPEGTGWMSLEVKAWGEAKVKGKLPDGTGFSAKAILFYGNDGELVFSFYDNPRDSRLAGQFVIGEEVQGVVGWERSTSDDEYYPRGFQTTIEATGYRYVPPDKGRRALENGGENDLMTITFNRSENVPTFSRNLRVSESDKVIVLNGGNEDLNVKIDREKGTFKTKFTDGSGNRRKGTGVLIQARTDTESPRGVGVYRTDSRTSRIDIALTSNVQAPNPPTTPNPNPNPTTPIPNVPNVPNIPNIPNGGNGGFGGNNGGFGGFNGGGRPNFGDIFDDFVFDPE